MALTDELREPQLSIVRSTNTDSSPKLILSPDRHLPSHQYFGDKALSCDRPTGAALCGSMTYFLDNTKLPAQQSPNTTKEN